MYSQTTGFGLRTGYVSVRDDDGTILVPDTVPAGTMYPGLPVHRSRALTITPAEPQRVTARGDDVNYYTFIGSPTDMPTGELRTQQSDMDMIALISNTKVFGSGNMQMLALATDKVGSEDPVIIHGSRIAVTSEPGQPNIRVWETYLLANALAYARPQGFEDSSIGEFIWNVICNPSSVDPAGRTLTEATHGCTESAYFMLKHRYPMMLEATIAPGAETDFTVTKGARVVSDADFFVTVDGEDASATMSEAGVLTLSSPPADGAKVVVLYQYSLA